MRKSHSLAVIISALLMMLSSACSSQTTNGNANSSNANKASVNSNATGNDSTAVMVERENAITITSDGAKYLDRAVLPDSVGSSQTKPYTTSDRLRVSLSPRFDNLGDIRGFIAELIPPTGTSYKANGAVPVSSSTNVDMEFVPFPPPGGYNLSVWAVPRSGSAPIQIATGKVFIDNQ